MPSDLGISINLAAIPPFLAHKSSIRLPKKRQNVPNVAAQELLVIAFRATIFACAEPG
jgi:hypothetical protein